MRAANGAAVRFDRTSCYYGMKSGGGGRGGESVFVEIDIIYTTTTSCNNYNYKQSVCIYGKFELSKIGHKNPFREIILIRPPMCQILFRELRNFQKN